MRRSVRSWKDIAKSAAIVGQGVGLVLELYDFNGKTGTVACMVVPDVRQPHDTAYELLATQLVERLLRAAYIEDGNVRRRPSLRMHQAEQRVRVRGIGHGLHEA